MTRTTASVFDQPGCVVRRDRGVATASGIGVPDQRTSTDQVTTASPAGPVAVTVVDDHELVSTAIVFALRAHGVPAESCFAPTVPAILARAALRPRGVVLLDMDLGHLPDGRPVEGYAAVAPLTALGHKVLVVSGSAKLSQTAAAIAAGAIGEISKSSPFDTLVRTVIEAANGRPVMSAAARAQWRELDRQERLFVQRHDRLLGRLTARERAVLDRLAQGHRAATIAAEFVVSLATVRSQIRSILVKLEVGSQLEAAALLRATAR